MYASTGGSIALMAYRIGIQQIGDQFVTTVPATGAVVTGETEEAALREAVRSIVVKMIEEAEKQICDFSTPLENSLNFY